MHVSVGRGLWVLIGLMACQTCLAEFRGRRISDVLDELRAQGLTFIYSTQRIPPELRVTTEPTATRGTQLAQEVLAPHGLMLSEVAPRLYAIVADPSFQDRKNAGSNQSAVGGAQVQEIIVQSSRYAVAAEVAPSQAALTQDGVKDTPRLADETLRVLQRLPGVATNGFSSMGSIRGGAPNESAIVLDGLRLYEPFHLKDFMTPVSLLDSRLIDRIEFYSGGFPAPFGERMSGIVDATSVRPGQPRYYELGLNLFHASALMSREFSDGRGHILLSARRGNAGDLAQFSENKFGRPHYSDGFGRMDYRFSERTDGSMEVLLSDDSIEALKSSGSQRAVAEYSNVYAWATLRHAWSDAASTRLIFSYTDLTNERQGTVDQPDTRFITLKDDRLFHIAGIKLDSDVEQGRIAHRFGAQVQRLWGQYNYDLALAFQPDYPFPGSPASSLSRQYSPRPKGYEMSAYWDGKLGVGKRVTLQAGVRLDTQDYGASAPALRNRHYLSPRFAALYRFDSGAQLRASWGRYFQSQGINELEVEDGIEDFYPAQHADHAIVSLDHDLTANINLRVEVYRKWYEDLHPRFENLFDQQVLFPESEFDRVRIDATEARADGAEVFVKFRASRAWSGWLGYTWSRIDDRVDGMNVPRSWDQRHAFNFGLRWSSGPWSGTLASIYHTGWPITQLALTAGANPSLMTDVRNRDRLGAYSTVDMRLTRAFTLRRGQLDVFAEVTNAMAKENPCCVRYTVSDAPSGSSAFTRTVDSWLPLVPSMGVLWRY